MDLQLQELIRLEELLQAVTEESPSNVIPLRRPAPFRVFSSTNDKRWMFRLDCLIESLDVSEIHRMALELHSHSRRYAFVEFKDLSSDCRQDFGQLMQLGAITLFVSDIMDLSQKEQATLLQMIEQETEHRPLLIVGTSLNYPSIRGQAGINLELLSILARAYIKLNRPFADYKAQGLMHYFLDSLCQSPT